jgi:hypothetical protein
MKVVQRIQQSSCLTTKQGTSVPVLSGPAKKNLPDEES